MCYTGDKYSLCPWICRKQLYNNSSIFNSIREQSHNTVYWKIFVSLNFKIFQRFHESSFLSESHGRLIFVTKDNAIISQYTVNMTVCNILYNVNSSFLHQRKLWSQLHWNGVVNTCQDDEQIRRISVANKVSWSDELLISLCGFYWHSIHS